MKNKLIVRWSWRNWTVGVVLPHGGMVVWCFMLGPLVVEFWPLAGPPTLGET